MTTKNANYRLFLVQELERRQRRNPAYSLRAFARHLGLSHTTLSEVIAGKRPLSSKAASRIVARCDLPEREAEALLAEAKVSRKGAYTELNLDTFAAISDWPYYTLMSLADIPGNEADPKWLGSMLGLSSKTASKAFERLVRLGILELEGTGFRQTSRRLTTRQDLASEAVRGYHHRILHKAGDALDATPVEERDFSAITMAVDVKKLAQAKDLIRKFRRDLAALMEDGQATQVYTLCVQLFPTSKSITTSLQEDSKR